MEPVEDRQAVMESEQLRAQVRKVLTAWVERAHDQLESANWHLHWDTGDDVLVVVTKHDVAFRVVLQSVQFTKGELLRRRIARDRIAEGLPPARGRGRPRGS
jgi:hypothetical protein